MSSDQNAIKYVKHNKIRIKRGIKREEITKMLFWSSLKKGLTSKKGSRYGGVVGRRQKAELTEVESMHQYSVNMISNIANHFSLENGKTFRANLTQVTSIIMSETDIITNVNHPITLDT